MDSNGDPDSPGYYVVKVMDKVLFAGIVPDAVRGPVEEGEGEREVVGQSAGVRAF